MARLVLGVVSCAFFLSVSGLYSPSDDVIELTPSNFHQEVVQSDSLWLVEFFAPWCGHCQQLTPEWKKAATALKGVVRVGAVNADRHQSLGGQYGVRGFPTIKIFGSNKNRPEDYQGGRTADAIVDAALSALRQLVKDRLGGRGYSQERQGQRTSSSKKDVIELTDDSFDKHVLNSEDVWMVEFYAPWCGHCKNLEPEWAAAATEVAEQTKGKVKLAAVDATANQMLTGRYGIRGFPTIKIFQKGESPVDYDGGRTRSDIVSRALDLFSDNAPSPELLEIIHEDITKKTCEEHQLCVVAVLPHILDTGAAGRNSYLDLLLKLADKYKKKMWGWLWTEAGAQSELESALGIGGFGYPAMAAINVRKMKFALLKGSFSEQGINEFLRELSFGRGSTAPMGGGAFPAISTREPWDGQDGEGLPVTSSSPRQSGGTSAHEHHTVPAGGEAAPRGPADGRKAPLRAPWRSQSRGEDRKTCNGEGCCANAGHAQTGSVLRSRGPLHQAWAWWPHRHRTTVLMPMFPQFRAQDK